MHPRRGIIALLAVGTSVALHAAVLSSFQSVRLGGNRPAAQPFEEMTVVYAPDEDVSKKDKFPEFDIGEVGATGYASHRTSGDRTAVAREAPVDQAALSLDPVGTTLRPEVPSPDAGDADREGAAPRIALAVPPAAAENTPRLAPLSAPPPDRPALIDPAPAPTVPPRVEPSMIEPALPVAPLAAQALVAPKPAPAPAPTAPVMPTPVIPTRSGGADPAPMSDSESDAFSVLGSAQFVAGELRVRAGRKVRSRRPKIGLSGQLDTLYSRAEVTLRVAVDATGKVTSAEVVKSSGSNEIDQPCRVSMYDWWFEPKKDRAGKPIPDVFNFTIGFR